MDVTIGSLAATQLRGNGSRENQADVIGSSFDLFLNLNEAVGPMQAMENYAEQERPDDRGRDQSTSSNLSDKHETEPADDRARYESKRHDAAVRPKAREQHRDDLALLADQSTPPSTRDEVPQHDVSEVNRQDNGHDSDTDSLDASGPDENDLAGAQGQTVEINRKLGNDGDKVESKTLVEFKPDLNTTDDLEFESVELENLKIQNIDVPVQESKTVDINELKPVSNTHPIDELDAEDAAFDSLEQVEVGDDIATQNRPQRTEFDPLQNDAESSSLFELDGVDKTDDSRFLDDIAPDSQSDSFDGETENGQFEMMSGGDTETPEVEGEWSRLLQGNSLADKVSQSSRLNTGDSVRLGATATRVSQLDSGGARAPSAPGLVQDPAKANAPTPTKLAQPPTPGRLPDGVDELSIFRQISDAMKLRNGRIQRADIRLSPEELGAVRVQMEMKNGAVRVLVNTENSAVGDLVSNGLEQLRRDMLAQGVQVDQMEVRSELAGQDGQTDQPSDENDEATARNEQDEKHVQRRRNHGGRLSVQA